MMEGPPVTPQKQGGGHEGPINVLVALKAKVLFTLYLMLQVFIKKNAFI